MLRSLRTFVEIIAALVGIVVVCGLLLAWRLGSAPVNPAFLTPYIKTGIEGIVPDSKVELESILLTWESAERSLAIHAKNIKISNVQGNEIADIPIFEMKMSLLGLLLGQLIPKELVIDHPQIKLDRDKDGTFVFGGVAVGGGTKEARSEPDGGIVNNVAEHLSRAAFTHKLAVMRAVFDIRDERTQKEWAISIPEISVRRNGFVDFDRALRYGALDGHIIVDVPQADAEASLNIHYLYDPSIRQHSLTSVFSNVTPSLVAGGNLGALGLGVAAIVDLPLTGKAEFVFDDNLTLIKIAAQIHGDEGHFVYPDYWDTPCPVKNFDLDAKYNRITRKLTVSDASIDFAGPVLDVKIEGKPSSQKGQDLDFTAEVKVDNLPMNKYGEIWPKPVLPNPRYWLTANLHEGTFDHAEVTLKGAAAFDDIANLSIAEGGGKIQASGGRVTYIEGMPPVEGVGAAATFDLKKMDVQITGGGIGNIRLLPFMLQITGLAEYDQIIDIPMQVSGPLPEILQLLDHPPLGYAKALGLSPNELDGKIEGTVNFRFPLLKALQMKDLAVHAKANTTALASTKLIPGIPIDQGNMALDLDTSGFNLKGQFALGKAPFRVVWQEMFEQKAGKPLRQVTATGSIRDDQWNNLGVTAFNGTKGPIKASLEMTRLAKNKTVYTGALDMTQAVLVVDMLNWKKPADVSAILTFSAEAVSGKPISVSPITLSGTGVKASGNAVLSVDMSQLLSFDFAPIVLGRTDATLQFKQDFGENGALRFDAEGASLDVSGLRGGNDPDRNDPRPKEYHIQVDRLYTGENGHIDKAQGFASRDKSGWREINFHGLADGDTPLSIELTPKPDGTRTFKSACQDFGKALKGLGFTDTVRRGKITVAGQSTIENPRTIKGSVKINNFTVVKLPALALLLNATSPFGFSNILTDSADFSRFEGEFVWQGDEIALTRAHAAGSAIGINLDGKVDMNSNNANLQGTLVPFSVVNSVLNSIPLIGDLLTGGKDQGVLAVAYEINGNLDSPKVSVNPISLLTPGFIRNLFFTDDETEDEEPEGKTNAP